MRYEITVHNNHFCIEWNDVPIDMAMRIKGQFVFVSNPMIMLTGAFFLRGFDSSLGTNWIMIECWRDDYPEAIQDLADYLQALGEGNIRRTREISTKYL